RLLIISCGSAAVSILVTVLTRPARMNALADFYRRTRPVGVWEVVRKYSRAQGQVTPTPERIARPLAGWLWGVMLVVGLTLAIGYTVLLNAPAAAFWYLVTIGGAVGLWKSGFLKTHA
ncbi:MAG: hypothetical protein PHI18_00585, partial [bacterium]|nr:hypothetical protein [bacterium]